ASRHKHTPPPHTLPTKGKGSLAPSSSPPPPPPFPPLLQLPAACLPPFSPLVPIVQQRAEQRRRCRHTTATLRQSQRRMLMPNQLRQHPMHVAHSLHRTLPSQINAHRQGVDEDSHHSLRPFSSLHPSEQHRAEHHVFAPTTLPQHQSPRQMK